VEPVSDHASIDSASTDSAATDSGGAAADTDPAIWRVTGSPLVSGAGTGPLAGYTVAVKDIFSVSGHAVGAGNPTWLAEAPVQRGHAEAVDALLRAGADVVGIAQTDELAFSLFGTNAHYGTPPNPAAPDKVTGGSSNGPASAVALGLADIGLGTDTGGSIRVPASHCGLYGLRPTHGAVSVTGVQPLAASFDTVGWLTRDAETLQRVAAVLTPDDAAPVSRLLLAEDLFALAEPGSRPVLRAAAEDLASRHGLSLETTAVLGGDDIEAWLTAFRTIQTAEAWSAHGDWLREHPGAVQAEIAERFWMGSRVTPDELSRARRLMADVRRALDELVPPGSCLVQPAAGGPPPPRRMDAEQKNRARAGTLQLTCPAGLAGLPVVAVPGGRVPDGPVGLCLVGHRGSDAALAALAGSAAPAAG
jgi:amidase